MADREILFLLSADLSDGFVTNPHLPNGFKFKSRKPFIDIRIKANDGKGYSNLRAKLRCSKVVSEDYWAFVSKILENEYLICYDSPIELPHINKRGEETIDRNGTIKEGYSIPFHFLPDGLRIITDEIRNNLEKTLRRFLGILRWRQDDEAPSHDFYEHTTLYWNVSERNEKVHHLCPLLWQEGDFGPGGIIWRKGEHWRIRKLWNNENIEEPLGHELLREARNLIDIAPRSALLVGCSSLETIV